MGTQRDEAFEKAIFTKTEFDIIPMFDEEDGIYKDENLTDHYVDKVNFALSVWQAAKASVVPEWISVKDRLPGLEQEVLLLSSRERLVGQYLPAVVNEFGIHFDGGFWINGGASIVDATHWIPLLDLPEAQEPSND